MSLQRVDRHTQQATERARLGVDHEVLLHHLDRSTLCGLVAALGQPVPVQAGPSVVDICSGAGKTGTSVRSAHEILHANVTVGFNAWFKLRTAVVAALVGRCDAWIVLADAIASAIHELGRVLFTPRGKAQPGLVDAWVSVRASPAQVRQAKRREGFDFNMHDEIVIKFLQSGDVCLCRSSLKMFAKQREQTLPVTLRGRLVVDRTALREHKTMFHRVVPLNAVRRARSLQR